MKIKSVSEISFDKKSAMKSDFLKYFKILPNNNKCKFKKLSYIRGNVKRHIIDLHPNVAEKMNLSVKKKSK